MSRVLKREQLPEALPRWPERGGGPRDPVPGAEAVGAAIGIDEAEVAAREEVARQEGRERGAAEVEARYRDRTAKLEALSASLQTERSEFFDRIEPELVRLAVSIAEKVIGSELELRPEIVVGLIRGAMKRLRDREQLRVSVNPRDAERVKEAREELIASVDGVRKLEVVEDRRVDAGGCVIESGNGTLDARIRTQLDEIGRALGEMLPSGREEPRPAGSEIGDSGSEVRGHPRPESVPAGGSSD